MTQREVFIKNLMATSFNIIGVIEQKAWERLPKKLLALKDALELLKKYIESPQEKATESAGVENEKLKSLLRELVMRSQLTFPECIKDQELWEEGIKDQPELFLQIGKALNLGNVEEEFNPHFNYKTAKEYEKTENDN